MLILNIQSLKRNAVGLVTKIAFSLICFVMKMIRFILFMYQMKKFSNCMDFLSIADGNKSHYVYIKDFEK